MWSYLHIYICPVFSFNYCTFLAIITSSFSPFQVSGFRLGNQYFFCHSRKIQFFFAILSGYLKYSANIIVKPRYNEPIGAGYLTLPHASAIMNFVSLYPTWFGQETTFVISRFYCRSILSVSSRLFINLYVVIKSHFFCLLIFS